MDSTAESWPIDELLRRAQALNRDGQIFVDSGALDILPVTTRRVIKDYSEAVAYLTLAVSKLYEQIRPIG